MYVPDRWVIVKVTKENDTGFRILGSWYGGYLDGDSWRMSSGVVKYEDHDDHYAFHNHSGSIYTCHKNALGMSAYTSGVLQTIQEQGQKQSIQVEVVTPEEFIATFKEESDETKSPPSA